MEVQFPPELEAKLDKLAKDTGRAQSEYVQDALYAYFGEMVPVRAMLDRRYDEIISGKVKPMRQKTSLVVCAKEAMHFVQKNDAQMRVSSGSVVGHR